MDISVVIPTCNRKARLMSLLTNLVSSAYPLSEVIIVDSGEDRLIENDLLAFTDLNITYLDSVKSVCIQRNKGISVAKSEWIFSIFNVYSRNNAYSITFDKYGNARKLSVLGSVFPSLTYSFKI